MTTISKQLDHVRATITESELKHHRAINSVQLLAVSKRHSVDAIRAAYEQQQHHFGENYLNEALDKQTQLSDLAIHWHYIGSIQSNKTRKIAESFEWVHTVENLKIANRLSSQRPEHLAPLNICLQINIDKETSKSGLMPDIDALAAIVETIIQLPNVTLRGLMCIPAPKENPAQEIQSFQAMQSLLDQLNQRQSLSMDTLSMGMSGDIDSAIQCGATIVRVGTAIFGQRQ